MVSKELIKDMQLHLVVWFFNSALHLGGFDAFENIVDNVRLIEIVQMYPSRSKLFATL